MQATEKPAKRTPASPDARDDTTKSPAPARKPEPLDEESLDAVMRDCPL